MNLFKQFKNNWQENFSHLSSANNHLFIAVSGGVDSCVLLHLVSKLKLPTIILHCNFQLRGEESKRDEVFVNALAKQYNTPILVKHFDTATYANETKSGIQEAARKLRYNWFASVLTECDKPNFLLTAHNADDSVETVL
jgi:tRNA(Ile)-lysidine synthase